MKKMVPVVLLQEVVTMADEEPARPQSAPDPFEVKREVNIVFVETEGEIPVPDHILQPPSGFDITVQHSKDPRPKSVGQPGVAVPDVEYVANKK